MAARDGGGRAAARKRKGLAWIFGIAAGAACAIGALALWNFIATRDEARDMAPPGKMVAVGGGRMHVYATGRGDRTVILLSGYGNPCPVVDFAPLIKALSPRYRVAVVDYFGYGWSDPAPSRRSSGNIVEETRQALRGAGIEPPYILAPHSLSGIYALHYAREHPDEVSAIIALDTSVPETNNYVKDEGRKSFTSRSFLRISGVMRLISLFRKNLGGYPGEFYSEAEIATMDRMILRNIDNGTMIEESNEIYGNRRELIGAAFPPEIPFAMILADSSVADSRRYLNGMDWLGEHRKQIASSRRGGIHVLHGSHNIYRNNAEEIAGIIDLTMAGAKK
jgi:pimeloyl-ACP methyl ester carboxylesterase